MTAFRELRYGGLFFLSAMAGLLVGGFIGAGIAGHGTVQADEMAGLTAAGAVAGAVIGSIAWLAYHYSNPKQPPG
jgi:hypothetical protein